MDRFDCDRMFVAVLETGSFARAARRLGTSSGQASKLVSKLESDLGVRLLNRTTRALSPTEVGQAYFERVKALIEEFESLDAAVRNASGVATGRLRLSVPLSFGTRQLAPVLMAFAKAFPDIQLDVSFSDRLVSLIDEGFDAAIRVGNPNDTTLIARRLCDMRVVVAASADYVKQRGAPGAPVDLARHDCIIDTNFREPYLWRFRGGTESAETTVSVSGRLRFSNAEACLAAAEAGLGIARIPSFLAGPRFRTGDVVPLLQDWEDRPLGVHVLYPPGRHLAHKVRVLVDFLAAQFRGEPSWDRGW
ncbi:MAG TPA: LysR family transcriptional regulator [Telmatospirillum sp.]|nr:LysR family transcriptional regulator [Telmatospirillum sp.]